MMMMMLPTTLYLTILRATVLRGAEAYSQEAYILGNPSNNYSARSSHGTYFESIRNFGHSDMSDTHKPMSPPETGDTGHFDKDSVNGGVNFERESYGGSLIRKEFESPGSGYEDSNIGNFVDSHGIGTRGNTQGEIRENLGGSLEIDGGREINFARSEYTSDVGESGFFSGAGQMFSNNAGYEDFDPSGLRNYGNTGLQISIAGTEIVDSNGESVSLEGQGINQGMGFFSGIAEFENFPGMEETASLSRQTIASGIGQGFVDSADSRILYDSVPIMNDSGMKIFPIEMRRISNVAKGIARGKARAKMIEMERKRKAAMANTQIGIFGAELNRNVASFARQAITRGSTPEFSGGVGSENFDVVGQRNIDDTSQSIPSEAGRDSVFRPVNAGVGMAEFESGNGQGFFGSVRSETVEAAGPETEDEVERIFGNVEMAVRHVDNGGQGFFGSVRSETVEAAGPEMEDEVERMFGNVEMAVRNVDNGRQGFFGREIPGNSGERLSGFAKIMGGVEENADFSRDGIPIIENSQNVRPETFVDRLMALSRQNDGQNGGVTTKTGGGVGIYPSGTDVREPAFFGDILGQGNEGEARVLNGGLRQQFIGHTGNVADATLHSEGQNHGHPLSHDSRNMENHHDSNTRVCGKHHDSSSRPRENYHNSNPDNHYDLNRDSNYESNAESHQDSSPPMSHSSTDRLRKNYNIYLTK